MWNCDWELFTEGARELPFHGSPTSPCDSHIPKGGCPRSPKGVTSLILQNSETSRLQLMILIVLQRWLSVSVGVWHPLPWGSVTVRSVQEPAACTPLSCKALSGWSPAASGHNMSVVGVWESQRYPRPQAWQRDKDPASPTP